MYNALKNPSYLFRFHFVSKVDEKCPFSNHENTHFYGCKPCFSSYQTVQNYIIYLVHWYIFRENSPKIGYNDTPQGSEIAQNTFFGAYDLCSRIIS